MAIVHNPVRPHLPEPVRKESPVQTIQGYYYMLVGFWAAIFPSTLQSTTSPVFDLSHMWVLRVLGAGMVALGFLMVVVAKRREVPFLATLLPLVLALSICIAELVGMATNLIPSTFGLDAGMQFGFFVWWIVAIFFHTEQMADPAPGKVSAG